MTDSLNMGGNYENLVEEREKVWETNLNKERKKCLETDDWYLLVDSLYNKKKMMILC